MSKGKYSKKSKEVLVLEGFEKDHSIVDIPEISIHYSNTRKGKFGKMTQSAEVVEFIRSLFADDTIEVQEQFIVLYLDKTNNIKGYYRHTTGGITSTLIDRRLILSIALKTLSISIILAHNHPSGIASPSLADKEMTKIVIKAASDLDIQVLDHVIITTKDYYSFQDNGLMGIITSTRGMKNNSAVDSETGGSHKIERYTEDLKIIRRFRSLIGKKKTARQILNTYRYIQKAIQEKAVRKSSPLSGLIQEINNKMLHLCREMARIKAIETNVKINDKNFQKRLDEAVHNYEIYPSIKFLRQYINLQGETPTKKRVDLLIKQMQNAVRTGKLTKDDPYAEEVNRVYKTLNNFSEGKSRSIALTQSELNGIAQKCGCPCNKNLGTIYKTGGKEVRQCKKKTYSDAKKGACSYNGGLAGAMTAEQVKNLKFDLLPFTGTFRELLGKPEKNFSLMIHGEPGGGKSTFLMKFIKYLATLGNVLYVSSEEYLSTTLTENTNLYLNPTPENIIFTHNIYNEDAHVEDADFIILDSVNDMGLNYQSFKALKEQFPDKAFIIVLQHTKNGQFRGGKEWEHLVQIAAEVERGVITVYKNRYGVKSSWNFFDETPVETTFDRDEALKSRKTIVS